ncbi:MADS-box transcription factor 26-like isoform X2 [Iris pallida]|uniref:MADS-box transcription factor 26-like isoform X2 n=1 Tax=Iris pallida TaxID=29817 RepID=A0AAX6GQR1_IRIPA|nr:MADS-box transcription factor 26-like isoform X2 [Iris pallida]KAJ6801868.1 MADS-box transcription factor 26-like isoform X2 [Iris pallida]KAJ6830645.1 MADS-box transcription factor 26-like isoform X2 [Iris pallida]
MPVSVSSYSPLMESCMSLPLMGKAMQDLIQRYKSTCSDSPVEGGETNQSELQETVHEISTLKQEIDLLQKGLSGLINKVTSCMLGEQPRHMTLDELQGVERHLEIWMHSIRSAKMQIMFQEIQVLRNKEGILKSANKILVDKIIEQNGAFDVCAAVGEVPYPLTIQNGIFNFTV